MEYMGMNLPGLCIESTASGVRIRVRVEGDKNHKISIPANLDKETFLEAYRAARQGIMTEYRPTTLPVMARRPGFFATVYNMLSRAKQRARKKGFEFDLVTDDIIALLERQNGRCAVSGMQFDIRPHPRKGAKRPFCMSIDRIDNGLGYTKGNVRITTVIVNTALLNWKEEDFQRMCQAVTKVQMRTTVVSLVGHISA
jgi:hypothetical protein